jgi:hypothetical protein
MTYPSPEDLIVPAASGATVLVLFYKLGDEPPTEGDIGLYRLPVLAWRISAFDAIARPVILALPVDATLPLVELPDGSMCEPWGQRHYATLEAAKADMLRFAKEAWDEERQRRLGGVDAAVDEFEAA